MSRHIRIAVSALAVDLSMLTKTSGLTSVPLSYSFSIFISSGEPVKIKFNFFYELFSKNRLILVVITSLSSDFMPTFFNLEDRKYLMINRLEEDDIGSTIVPVYALNLTP